MTRFEEFSEPQSEQSGEEIFVEASERGLHVPREAKIIEQDGFMRWATLADVEATGIKNDVQVVEVDGTTQLLSDGTYYDSEYEIYYE